MDKTKKIVHVIILAILSLGLLSPVSVLPISTPENVHPALLQIADETPGRMIKVIIQKADTSDRVEQLVEKMGGEVTKELHILNAFAAELKAEDAVSLGKLASVNWVYLDAPVKPAKVKTTDGNPEPQNYYLDTLGVRQIWDMGYKGEGITVAVIDSGIHMDRDFKYLDKKSKIRIFRQISFSESSFKTSDSSGHGTHVAGIIGGNGQASAGAYRGIAPNVGLLNLKISDETGMARESDTVEALQWALDNMDRYNIRVVNLSINSTVEGSYHTSALDAAAEILWFNGIVVVVSSGNKAKGNSGVNTINAAPANDPFVITVGATNENATADISDDSIARFSAYGTTTDGYFKPEILAPGRNIVSVLSDASDWDMQHPERVVLNGEYFRLSGTSMSAPMVSGAVALLLQAEPNLTPDQVKYRLIQASYSIDGTPYLNIYAALTSTTMDNANTGIPASQLLWTGDDPLTWDSVNWNSVNWNSVNWNSVNWNSVNWNSVNWNSVFWGD